VRHADIDGHDFQHWFRHTFQSLSPLQNNSLMPPKISLLVELFSLLVSAEDCMGRLLRCSSFVALESPCEFLKLREADPASFSSLS
jgi:hypothetical protein